jgi:uncharacterized membrane protein YphA (DoxX/SURF4 family)
MSLPIPIQVLYAGLGGTILALFVATYQQNWQPRVFLLLVLRLAIGWHFMFEGLHKIHSHWVGATETNRPFTSEPYFALADGPFGDLVRKQALGDVDATIRERITPDPEKLASFNTLSRESQAALCPKPIADLLDKAFIAGVPKQKEEFDKLKEEVLKATKDDALKLARAEADKSRPEVKTAEDAYNKASQEAEVLRSRAVVLEADLDPAKKQESWPKVMEARAKAKQAADQAAQLKLKAIDAANKLEVLTKKADAIKKKSDERLAKLDSAGDRINATKDQALELKASYARWLYGVDRRDAKAKFVSMDVPQSVPERLAHIKILSQQLESLKARQSFELGQGYTHEQKRTTAAKNDLNTAKADLVADADAFVKELVEYAGGEVPKPEAKPIVQMDKLTMWTLTIAGACIFFGFMTPLACLVAAGFLVLTYLSHPPFPWLPLPPNTEGNPLFINKNVIEAIALLVIAVHPTGRWLGLDALWTRLILGTGTPEPICHVPSTTNSK